MLSVLVPVGILIGAELALSELDLHPPPPAVERRMRANGTMIVAVPSTDGRTMRTVVPLEKPPGVRRTIVVGDSTVYGMFLQPESTIGRFLEALLPATVGGDHEVFTIAAPAISTAHSGDIVDVALEHLDADTIVVYAGHNELLQPFLLPELERIERPWRAALWDALDGFRVGRMLLSLRPEQTFELQPGRRKIRLASRTQAARAVLLERFERELAAIARSCAERGVQLVLPMPVSNAREHGPFVSAFSRKLDEAAQRRYGRHLLRARRNLGRGDLEEAAEELRKAERLDPEVADLLHLQGRLAWCRGEEERARELGRRSWGADEDGRAASLAILERHRAVAEAGGALFVDLGPVMERVPADGESPIFMDYAHPTVYGQYLFAREVAAAMAGTAESTSTAGAPSFDELCRRLEIPATLVSMSDQARVVGPVVLSILSDDTTVSVTRLRTVLAGTDSEPLTHPMLVGGHLVLALHDGDFDVARRRAERLAELDPAACQQILLALRDNRRLGPALVAAGLELPLD